MAAAVQAHDLITTEGPAVTLAFIRADGVPVPMRRLPFRHSQTLFDRAGEGPWVEARTRRPWHPYDQLDIELATAAFRPAFQPIVELESNAVVGYEALARFSAETPPAVVFEEARITGLGVELELATLAAALKAATGLPPGTWLSLNVSPDCVTAKGPLADVLCRADRSIVLEITEHVPISDYAALRAAVRRLRPRVRLAVDDAGVGVANFSHIVELRPDFVKLDISLVSGLDRARSRQALVIGLQHFARRSHSSMIAEGVETEAELTMLRKLGVPYAQGFLLGRPQAVG